ncbi:MAG: hypothetical protein OFPII_25920 [Osedax symbiont Rs1]|nr:MAG: hypothetical protein OFPII_25920 [Osedax symbiont Rs1]
MELSVVVLAGGQGQRMGGLDKGLVVFNDRRMIEWVLDTVRPLTTQLMISCNRNITDYMALADSVVCDRIAGSLGPLAGIHAAMESMTATHLLVLPCDTPKISRAVIEQLIEAAQRDPQAVVFLRYAEFIHPLHAIVPLSLKSSLESYLLDGGRAVRKWCYQHRVVEVSVAAVDRAGLVNINTRADLECID